MLEGLLEVRHHEDAIAVLLLNLSLETPLLDRHEIVVQDARTEDNLQEEGEGEGGREWGARKGVLRAPAEKLEAI